MPIDLSRLSLIDQLLDPIQKQIRAIIPEFVEKNLRDPEVRQTIVSAVDAGLVANFPAAALIPTGIRRSIIQKQLDIILDDFVLGSDEAFRSLMNP